MTSLLRSSLAIALAAVAVPTVYAQSVPDLSGVWTLDAERSQLPEPSPPPAAPGGPPPPPRLVALTIRQTSTELEIDRTFVTARGQTVDHVICRLDGAETRHTTDLFVETTRASWAGSTLTLSTVQSASASFGPMTGKALATVVETYRVDGGALIVESVRTVNGKEGNRRRLTFAKIR